MAEEKRERFKKRNGEADGNVRSYMRPEMTPTRRADIERAAGAHVEANRSDPFARGRAVCHMVRGLELPSDMLADANAILEHSRRR